MSFRDEIWATIYGTRGMMRMLTTFLLFLFGLTVVSFLLGHQRETTTALAYANLVLTGGASLAGIGLYWDAARREGNH